MELFINDFLLIYLVLAVGQLLQSFNVIKCFRVNEVAFVDIRRTFARFYWLLISKLNLLLNIHRVFTTQTQFKKLN
jgi:hypothetical protein